MSTPLLYNSDQTPIEITTDGSPSRIFTTGQIGRMNSRELKELFTDTETTTTITSIAEAAMSSSSSCSTLPPAGMSKSAKRKAKKALAASSAEKSPLAAKPKPVEKSPCQTEILIPENLLRLLTKTPESSLFVYDHLLQKMHTLNYLAYKASKGAVKETFKELFIPLSFFGVFFEFFICEGYIHFSFTEFLNTFKGNVEKQKGLSGANVDTYLDEILEVLGCIEDSLEISDLRPYILLTKNIKVISDTKLTVRKYLEDLKLSLEVLILVYSQFFKNLENKALILNSSQINVNFYSLLQFEDITFVIKFIERQLEKNTFTFPMLNTLTRVMNLKIRPHIMGLSILEKHVSDNSIQSTLPPNTPFYGLDGLYRGLFNLNPISGEASDLLPEADLIFYRNLGRRHMATQLIFMERLFLYNDHSVCHAYEELNLKLNTDCLKKLAQNARTLYEITKSLDAGSTMCSKMVGAGYVEQDPLEMLCNTVRALEEFDEPESEAVFLARKYLYSLNHVIKEGFLKRFSVETNTIAQKIEEIKFIKRHLTEEIFEKEGLFYEDFNSIEKELEEKIKQLTTLITIFSEHAFPILKATENFSPLVAKDEEPIAATPLKKKKKGRVKAPKAKPKVAKSTPLQAENKEVSKPEVVATVIAEEVSSSSSSSTVSEERPPEILHTPPEQQPQKSPLQSRAVSNKEVSPKRLLQATLRVNSEIQKCLESSVHNVDWKELSNELLEAGFEFLRKKGSHAQFVHPEHPKDTHITLPCHQGRRLPPKAVLEARKKIKAAQGF